MGQHGTETQHDSAADSPKPATFTVCQAAKVLGIGRSLAYEAAARGELPTVRIGTRILVPRLALEEFLSAAGEAA